MAWIVKDFLWRAYMRFRTDLASEWHQFGRMIGVTFEVVDLLSWLPDLWVGAKIFVRRGMSAIETTWGLGTYRPMF